MIYQQGLAPFRKTMAFHLHPKQFIVGQNILGCFWLAMLDLARIYIRRSQNGSFSVYKHF